MIDEAFTQLEERLQEGRQCTPFLFLGNNFELLHHIILTRLNSLLEQYGVDAQSLFILPNTSEALKIDTVKNFIANGSIRPRFGFQIFYIENVSRMTPQAQNACLKFFEEPGAGNIIILTNEGKSGILETILSRVHTYQVPLDQHGSNKNISEFYISLIDQYRSGDSLGLIEYFFSGKYEKDEYIDFLRALIEYISATGNYRHLLPNLGEDMQGIMKNNLSARYIVDSYIMEL